MKRRTLLLLALLAVSLILLGAQVRQFGAVKLSSIIYEGTADAFETTVSFTDPVADTAVTLPDVAGSLLVAPTGGTATHGVLIWGDEAQGATNTGAEICALVDLQCAYAIDMTDGVKFTDCNTIGGANNAQADNLYYALCY